MADAIISLSEGVREFMNDDTVYIMSGIIDTRLDEVLKALEPSFNVFEVIEDNGWACIVARK